MRMRRHGWPAGRPTHPEWRRPAAGDEVRLRGARDNHILPAFGGAKAYGVPKAILQTAEDDSLITRNPCRFGGAGDAMRRRESVALSPSELAALADAMPRRWRALTLVSAVCRSSGREGMVWHDLRHTANTLAADADADASASQATRQARMGHADPRVSAIYLHTSTSDDRELADALFEMAARNEGTR